MKFSYIECLDKLQGKKYDECYKIVFGWVKQDKITPAVMESIIIDKWKEFRF